MKPNEIKNNLEKSLNLIINDGDLKSAFIIRDTIDLINQYESEIKNLYKLLNIKCDKCIKKELAEANKETDRLKAQIAVYEGWDNIDDIK